MYSLIVLLNSDSASSVATASDNYTCTCTRIEGKAMIYTPRTAFSLFKEKTALDWIRTHDTPRSRRALYQLSYQCVFLFKYAVYPIVDTIPHRTHLTLHSVHSLHQGLHCQPFINIALFLGLPLFHILNPACALMYIAEQRKAWNWL